MKGKDLKLKIESTGRSLKSIADYLEITPQALTSVFRADDVRSGTLERIAAALGKDMSFFYPSAPSTEVTTNITRSKVEAHNMHLGHGDITENASDTDIVNKLLDQNAQLIALLSERKR